MFNSHLSAVSAFAVVGCEEWVRGEERQRANLETALVKRIGFCHILLYIIGNSLIHLVWCGTTVLAWLVLLCMRFKPNTENAAEKREEKKNRKTWLLHENLLDWESQRVEVIT